MLNLPILDHQNLKDKKVLVRADLNVPMQQGKILDMSRLTRLCITLNELRHKEAKIVLMSHFGRPEGQKNSSLSLEPLAHALSEILSQPVLFVKDCIGAEAQSAVASLKSGDICLLENLRFYAQEEENDLEFARQLACLADFYCNDGFSVSHRAHASVVAITQFLPSFAGRLMQEELQALDKSLKGAKRPIAAIIAGSKISTKLNLLKNIVSQVDYLILGGGIANTFLSARGIDIGASLKEESMIKTAQDIEEYAKDHHCTLVLPLDAVVAMPPKSSEHHQKLDLSSIQSNHKIYDIGPVSRQFIKDILQQVKTVIWNGPLGVFEQPPFDEGTTEVALEVARLTQKGQLFSIAGGGETVAAVNVSGAGSKFTYLSTAGGAFLEWLEGKILPGVDALLKAHQTPIKVDKNKKAIS